jgi:beta-N-acetylhexosaminidase
VRRPRLAPGGKAAARRRKRFWPAAGAGAVVIIVLAAAVVSSAGSGTRARPSLPGANGNASVVSTPTQPATPRPPASKPFTPSPAAAARAAKLSLADQVAQLFLVSVGGPSSSDVAALGPVRWGGVVLTRQNFVSDGQSGALAADVASAAHSAGALPPLVAATQEGGSATAFPDLPPQSEPAEAASGQPAQAEAQAQLAGKRLRALNVNMTLAPLADVDTPGGALSGRLFSTDPGVVSRFTVAAVKGYAAAGVISAVGHFPGTGAASADPDQMTATVGGSLSQLRSRDLIPFTATAASAPVIEMSNAAYAAFDGVTPAGLLGAAVDLLRRRLGFQGVVMSDDLDATLDPTNSSPATVAVKALDAGDDLLYITGPPSEHLEAYHGVLAAAQASAAVRAQVRDALLRDLTLKARFGLLG